MKVLLDSGVWWNRYHGLPLHHSLKATLDRVTEWHLSPLSVAEMLYKWRHRPKSLPGPDPKHWLDHSLMGFKVARFSHEAARQAGLWEWEHGDPVDRMLAAIAKVENLTLLHTDSVLAGLPGFPQKYFPNIKPSPQPPGQSAA